MNKSMMDMLACPMDKHHPLELYEASSKGDVVSEGALFCPECSRFFPIIDEIPIMLPDELRDKKMELDFVARIADSMPAKITKEALPWHL